MSRPAASTAVSASDLVIVSGQLGRTARDVTGIAVRCPFARPAVIESSPTLGGMPNPTLLYLTCPSATTAISRMESAGGVRRFKSTVRGRSRSAPGSGRGDRGLPAAPGSRCRAGRRSAAGGRDRGTCRGRKRPRACTRTPRLCWPRCRDGSKWMLRVNAAAPRHGPRRRPGTASFPRGTSSGARTTGARAGRRVRRREGRGREGGGHRRRHHLGPRLGGRSPVRPAGAGVPAGRDDQAGRGAAAGRASGGGGSQRTRAAVAEIRPGGASAGSDPNLPCRDQRLSRGCRRC